VYPLPSSLCTRRRRSVLRIRTTNKVVLSIFNQSLKELETSV
jgi:hypothetical protein